MGAGLGGLKRGGGEVKKKLKGVSKNKKNLKSFIGGGANIRIGREIRCLLYPGFFLKIYIEDEY